MRVEVYPSKVSGVVTPPPSKSFLHRMIICASLAKGKSTIHNVSYSEDIVATLSAFESIGVKIDKFPTKIVIESKGLPLLQQEKRVNCNESGSTIRFLIPIFSSKYKALFTGNSTLFRRPFSIYEDIYESQGIRWEKSSQSILTEGALKPGNYIIPGDVSSQFISGLLFILPTLDGDSTIEVTKKFESSQYVDITVSVLKLFGINVEKIGNIYKINGNQKYVSRDVKTENDYSQLAFFAVLGMINNNIQVLGFNQNSLQPDRKILDFIEEMNGLIIRTKTSLEFVKSNTTGTTIDVSQSPDIAPILGLLAACSKGKTNIINAKRLVMKESNRLASTFDILKKLGVDVKIENDSLIIHGSQTLHGNEFDSYNDHRIVMTLAIAGTVCDQKLTINNAEAINKSYPDFFKDLQSLGAEIKYI